MQIFQKEQLNNNSLKLEMLDVLIILWIFSSAILKSVLYFFNIQAISGQLAIMYIIVAVISALLGFKYFSRMIPSGYLLVVLLFVVLGVSFVITGVRYGISEVKFLSEFKAYFAMAICSLLITVLVAWRKKKEINFNIIFVAIIILSLISFLSLFKGDSVTTGGYIRDSSGLIYQNVSYYSAQAFGLTLFHITETRKNKTLSWLYKTVCAILLIIQASTSILSGGRGGIVLLVVLLIATVIINMGKKTYKIVIPAAIFIVVIRFTVPWLINQFGINIKGITRIMSFFNGDLLNDGRFELYSQSLSLLGENPVFGKGIGSIFHYLHSYSHNLFMDILAESGVLGLLIFIVLLVLFIKKMFVLFRQGSLFRFLTYIFICGITLNLFSGYIWTNQLVWLPIAVVLTINLNEFEFASTENYISDSDNQEIDNSLDGENNG
jgi:O-antigen ligase